MSEISRKYFIKGYAQIIMHMTGDVVLNLREDYVSADGFALGKWLKEIREEWEKGCLPQAYIQKLEAIGISCHFEEQKWESMYYYAYHYFRQYGTTEISRFYRTDDGIMLGAWMERQRKYFDKLPDWKKEKLKRIGISAGDDTR